MPPKEGLDKLFHLISFTKLDLTPKFWENFNKIKLNAKEKTNAIPIVRITNNKVFF